jgi:hypothetical protein
MRSANAIIFVVLYGFALVRPALPLLDYYVKMEEYKALCINKARPEMKCNGQCILMQRLKAMNIETQEPAAPAPVKINFEDYPIGFIIDGHHRISARAGISPGDATAAEKFFFDDFVSDIFHPPLKTA